MLPVNPQYFRLGTGHVSAGSRYSTTQQAPINSHHCRQRHPLAGAFDDFYGDAPPPYYSLPPLGSSATRSTNAEIPRGTTRTVRRVKSESCASAYNGHDDDFLANLAAIQLLSGFTAAARRQNCERRCCCGIVCDGISCALDNSNLCMLSKELSKHPTRPVTIQQTLPGGADGHMSLASSDRVRTCAYCRSTPMARFVSHERLPSEDLDRRLQSIEDALHRDSLPSGTSKKRLHASEGSRKEQSLTIDDTVDVDHHRHDQLNVQDVSVKNTSHGIIGAFRNLQHKDRTRRWVFTLPSHDSSEMPSPYEAEVQESGQRTLLEDRSNMVMPHSLRDRISKRLQARSLSSRYGDFTFDPSPRRRRRNGRYSSVCMSSAEPTPLFNAPVPNQGQIIGDNKSQPSSWKSAIDPLATSSLMLATGELDRLTKRQVSDRGSEVLGSGQSSACGGPPNSPATKSLTPSEQPSSRLNTTNCGPERPTTSRNVLPLGINTRSGNSMSQSTAHAIRRQRMTSSRFSDVRTPENILEASDEDTPPATGNPDESCTPASLYSDSKPLHTSLASPTKITQDSCTTGSESGRAAVLFDRVIEQTSLEQDDQSKDFLASIGGRCESTPVVHHQMSPNDGVQPQTRKSPVHHVHTGALTLQNTRGLWCPPRKSPFPPRRHAAWNPDTSTGRSNE